MGEWVALGQHGTQPACLGCITPHPPAHAPLCFPLPLSPSVCLQLEAAGTAGVGFVVVLTAIIVRQSLTAGLPAIQSGELPLFKPAVAKDLPEAVAVLSFA